MTEGIRIQKRSINRQLGFKFPDQPEQVTTHPANRPSSDKITNEQAQNP